MVRSKPEGSRAKSSLGAPSEEREVNESVTTQLKQNYIRCFIDMSVLHVCTEACVIDKNKYELSSRIFERVRPQLQGEKMYVTEKSFKNLKRKVYKCICRKFKSFDWFYLMALLDSVLMDNIISLIKTRLMTPPEEKALFSRFFDRITSLCKGKCYD